MARAARANSPSGAHRPPARQIFLTSSSSRALSFCGTFSRPKHIIGVVRDITERRQAQMALAQAHAELEQRVVERTAELIREVQERKEVEAAQKRLLEILEATPDFVGMFSLADQRPLYLNGAGRALLGLAQGEVQLPPRIDHAHSEWASRKLREEILPAAIRQGVWSGEMAFLDPQGREIPVAMVVLAHRSPNGAVDRISTISRDITKQKQGGEADRRPANFNPPGICPRPITRGFADRIGRSMVRVRLRTSSAARVGWAIHSVAYANLWWVAAEVTRSDPLLNRPLKAAGKVVSAQG